MNLLSLIIQPLKAEGASPHKIAEALNERGIATARGVGPLASTWLRRRSETSPSHTPILVRSGRMLSPVDSARFHAAEPSPGVPCPDQQGGKGFNRAPGRRSMVPYREFPQKSTNIREMLFSEA